MADFNTFSLADIYSKAQAVRSAHQAEQMHGYQLQQLQGQQGVRDRLADFVRPDGSVDTQRAIPSLLKVGDYHSIAALAAMQKASKTEEKPLRAPTPFEYESASRGVRTGHPITDAMMMTPEGRAHAGNILRGGSSSTYVQGRGDDGEPAYIPMPSRPNAGGAAPAATVRPKYDPLSDATVKKMSDVVSQYGAISRSKNSFKEGFGGYGLDTLGDLALQTGAKFPGKPGAASQDAVDWWKSHRFSENPERHEIIGSAMTPQEIDSWKQTTISPGMSDKTIKNNLEKREEISRAVASRLSKTHAAGNHNPAQIRALLGEHADTLLSSPVAAPNEDPLVVDGYRFPNTAAARAYRKAKGK